MAAIVKDSGFIMSDASSGESSVYAGIHSGMLDVKHTTSKLDPIGVFPSMRQCFKCWDRQKNIRTLRPIEADIDG